MYKYNILTYGSKKILRVVGKLTQKVLVLSNYLEWNQFYHFIDHFNQKILPCIHIILHFNPSKYL